MKETSRNLDLFLSCSTAVRVWMCSSLSRDILSSMKEMGGYNTILSLMVFILTVPLRYTRKIMTALTDPTVPLRYTRKIMILAFFISIGKEGKKA
jgi:hypothetical protein